VETINSALHTPDNSDDVGHYDTRKDEPEVSDNEEEQVNVKIFPEVRNGSRGLTSRFEERA
jgi:hypothetical protein